MVHGGQMRDNHPKLKREKFRLTRRNLHKDNQAVLQVVRL